MPSRSHDASASALGYLYQTRYGLLALLRDGKQKRPDEALSLEMHDDVAWEQEGTPTELLSSKHHRTPKSLTDQGSDLWKSMSVWHDTGAASDPAGPRLTLVTTSEAPDGCAASLLRDLERDEVAAWRLLDVAARGKNDAGTQNVRDWFVSLGKADGLAFVARLRIVDAQPDMSSVDDGIRDQLLNGAPTGHEDLFFALVIAWWDKVAVAMLKKEVWRVTAIQARAEISRIRDQFGEDSLPTLVALADLDEYELLAAHADATFVTQMRWVKYTNNVLLRKAVVDYYRAVTHETRWLDEDLVRLSEMSEFRARLVDEWERAYATMLDDLGEDADADTKAAAGKAMLSTLLNSAAVVIRSQYTDPHLARGIRHQLADGSKVGWHPDFRDLLEGMLPAAV